MSFQGKVVLVTGASSGIGAATAIEFSKEGAQVSLIGRNQEKLKNVAKKCVNPLVLIADVSKDEDAKRIVDETIKHFGQLDVLVNNAGIATSSSITDDDVIQSFDRIIATNLRAPVLITNLAAPHLIKTKGNIINVSSVAAIREISTKNFCYNTSKAALDHFTRSIALDLASKGVRANTVNPGPVITDIAENARASKQMSEELFKQAVKFTALNRVSVSEEIADLILFLASDKARAITGASFLSDNGTALKGPMPDIFQLNLEL